MQPDLAPSSEPSPATGPSDASGPGSAPASSPASAPASAHSGATRRILKGPLAWEMARFGTPLGIGMAFQVTFNLVDAYLIARLPPAVAGPSIGAVGICDQIAAMGTIVSYGLSTATASILSQRKGARDIAGVRRVGYQSLLLTTLLSVIFGIAGILLAKPIMYGLVGAKGEVARLAVDYLQVILAGSFSIFFLLQITSILRALGSSKTPVAILIFGNILNLLLAILLVYGQGERPAVFDWSLPLAKAVHAPRMELVGAAWATIFARTIALIPAIFLLAGKKGDRILRPEKAWRRPIREDLARIWSLGWPSSTQFVVRVGATVAISAMIAHAFTTETDQTATTAYSLVFRVETMALFVSMGWGSAAQTFTGTCFGAGNLKRSQHAGWWASFYDVLAMALLAWAAVRWTGPILGFFDSNPKTIAMGSEYLRYVAPSYVAYGIAIVLGNAFAGMGATRLILRLDLILVLLIQIPLCVCAVLFLKTRVSLWNAIAIANIASAVLFVAVYSRSKIFQKPA